MLNRRAFLQHFGIGLAAACALASLPISAVEMLAPPEAAKRLACEHLRRVYNAWVMAHSPASPAPWHMVTPRVMAVSRGLYEAFEGEITVLERFTTGSRDDDPPVPVHLLFKGARLEPTLPDSRGWDVEFAA